jgi:hypothetical protein
LQAVFMCTQGRRNNHFVALKTAVLQHLEKALEAICVKFTDGFGKKNCIGGGREMVDFGDAAYLVLC